jgi:hypothetical protein
VSTASTLVFVLGSVAAAAIVVWFLVLRRDPENTASHSDGIDGVAPLHGEVTGRPAGPGGDGEGVPPTGNVIPGPGPNRYPSEGR